MASHRSPMIAFIAVLTCTIMAIPVIEAWWSVGERAGRITLFAALTCALLVVGGAALRRAGLVGPEPAERFDVRALAYVLALAIVWGMVIVDTPHATYFLLALIAISQWLLPMGIGSVVALGLTIFTITGQVVHHGASTGTIIGPALVVVLVLSFMHMYRAMRREAHAKSALIAELTRTREDLAASEREAGRLAERSRLGRDLHDTVAQSLSSIQLLLRLAEDGPRGDEHVRAARDVAAQALTETRSFISELSPPDLESRSLSEALAAIASRESERGLEVAFHARGALPHLSVTTEAALLRIAQASLANVRAHSGAGRCEVRLSAEPAANAAGSANGPGEGAALSRVVVLEIDDDGSGFDVDDALEAPARPDGGLGLTFVMERARELGGNAAIISAPGEGTLVSVSVPYDAPRPEAPATALPTPREAPEASPHGIPHASSQGDPR